MDWVLAHSALDSQEKLERIEFVHSHMPQGLTRLSSTCFKKTIEVSQHDARFLYSSHYLRASEKSENMFLVVADKNLTHKCTNATELFGKCKSPFFLSACC